MRILHTSDWHLGKSLYDFSLLDDQRSMLDRLLELLDSEGVDAVVIAGDVYDRPVPSARAVQLYDDFLSVAVGERKIPVLAIGGNHDSPGRLAFGSSLHARSGYHICGQARQAIHSVALEDEHGSVRFWLLPYLQPAEVRALFPARRDDIRTFDDAYRILMEENEKLLDCSIRNVMIAHGFFSPIGAGKTLLTSDSEINIGGMDIVDSSCFGKFDYTALGHLHAPQRAGGDNIRYSGSPLKYSLSEEHQAKSVTLTNLGPKGEVSFAIIPIEPLRDVRTVNGSLDELLDAAFHRNQHFGDYVFAVLTDTGALYPMEKLRKLFPNLLGLRLCGEGEGTMPKINVGGGMPKLSPEEMFRRFYREVKGFDMPDSASDFLREALMELDMEREEGTL